MKPTWENRRLGIRCYRGDCLRVLPTLRCQADFLLADPCYGTTKAAWDIGHDYERLLPAIAARLKPAAVQAWFAAGKFCYDLRNKLGGDFRYDLIWEKTIPVGFLDAKLKPLRAHEVILIASRRFKGTTYNPIKTKAERLRPRNAGSLGSRMTTLYSPRLWERTWQDSGERYPRSVLRFASPARHRGQHPTQKPVPLLEWLIRTYTHPGDLVLDFCFGSASTAIACINTGRRFVGCERDHTFFARAVRRIKEYIRRPS